MDNAELARLIVTDWASARDHLEALTLEERDGLYEGVVTEYTSSPPTDERAEGVAKYIKSLHFDPKATELVWQTKPEVLPHGSVPVAAWNRLAKGSLNHATLAHTYMAKYFLWMLSQTKVGDGLPRLVDKVAEEKLEYTSGRVLK